MAVITDLYNSYCLSSNGPLGIFNYLALFYSTKPFKNNLGPGVLIDLIILDESFYNTFYSYNF